MAQAQQHMHRPLAAWRTAGFWMAVPLALLQAVNAARAVIDPAGFAIYMGAPIGAASEAAWVLIYAARTAFIALLVAVFLARGHLAALSWVAAAALVMPLADAWIAHDAGAAASTVARHAAIALYVLVAAVVLFRSARAIAGTQR